MWYFFKIFRFGFFFLIVFSAMKNTHTHTHIWCVSTLLPLTILFNHIQFIEFDSSTSIWSLLMHCYLAYVWPEWIFHFLSDDSSDETSIIFHSNESNDEEIEFFFLALVCVPVVHFLNGLGHFGNLGGRNRPTVKRHQQNQSNKASNIKNQINPNSRSVRRSQ